MALAERVLITGANGLLGANLVKVLTMRGYRVRAFVRPQSNILALEGLDFELFRGSLDDEARIEQAMQQVDYVIHAAALTATAPEPWESFYQVNVRGTENLLIAARKAAVKRFVYISTANCFENGTKQKPGDENSAFPQWLRRSKYAYSKYLAQQKALSAATDDFQVIVIAPTFLIGPRDAKPSSGKLLLYALRSRLVFYPPGGKSFLDVEFAAEAIANALTLGKNREIYLLSGENLTYQEFFERVRKVAGRRFWLIPLPRWFVVGTSALFATIGKALNRNVVFDPVNSRLLTLDNYFRSEKAQKELKLQQTDTMQAIVKAIEWFKATGMV